VKTSRQQDGFLFKTNEPCLVVIGVRNMNPGTLIKGTTWQL